MVVLRNNWQGSEQLRAYVSSYPYYGCDHDEVDEIYVRLLQDFYLICKKLDDQRLYSFRYPAGVSTFGRELDWLPNRLATPEGTGSPEDPPALRPIEVHSFGFSQF